MTDRHTGYIVTLDNNIRADDSEQIINAIHMLMGVIDVTPVVSDITSIMAESKAKDEIRQKIWDILR